MKKHLTLLFIIIFLHSCSENSRVDCSAVLCAGPSVLAFEILQNGENVFDNGLTAEDVSIIGNFPDSYDFELVESTYNGGTKLLFVQQIEWEVTSYDFNIVTDAATSQDLSLDIILSTGECCGGIPQVSQFEVDGEPLENPIGVISLNLQ